MKLKKSILALIAAAALLFVCAACGGKTYTLTLDANGGTMSATSLSLKEGDNVYDAVKDLVPEKDGLLFGGWFEGKSELSPSRTMPASPLTLTARYKAGYTAEVYLQSGAQYLLSESDCFSGYAYTESEFTVDAPDIAGYLYAPAYTGSVATLTISENAAENVFKLYYAAAVAGRIVYNANAPEGTSASGVMADTVAGADGKAAASENGFAVAGYRFAGWSTSPRGSVNYAAGDEISLSGTLNLYAVWDMGYPDRFGGNDLIFLPQTEAGVAILSRGSAEIRGTVDGDGLLFTLAGSELRGKIFADTRTFAFAREELEGTYTALSPYYDPATGGQAREEGNLLTVDAFGTAVHSYADPATGSPLSDGGVLIYNIQTDEYLFYILEGNAAGGGFVFRLDRAAMTFSSTYGEGGAYTEFYTGDGTTGAFGEGGVYLDGYGGITFYSFFPGVYWIEDVYTNGTDFYIYKIGAIMEEINDQARDVLGFEVEDGKFRLSFYTIPLNEYDYGYVTPKAEAGSYASDEGTLELDGYRMFPDSATYTDGNGSVSGMYDVTATPRGELVVRLIVSDPSGMPTGSTLYFRIAEGQDGYSLTPADAPSETEYILLEDGNFSYRTVLAVYGESYEGVEGAVKASLLVPLSEGAADYVEGAAGYVTVRELAEGASLYTFTRTEEKGAFGLPSEFVCMLSAAYDNYYFSRELYYVFSYTYGETETVRYRTVTGTDGGEIWYMDVSVNGLGSLYFDRYGDVYAGGMTVYTNGEYTFGSVGVFVYPGEDGAAHTLYFDLELDGNGEPAYFTEIEELEYPLYERLPDGTLAVSTVRLLMRGSEAIYSPSGFAEGADDAMRLSVQRAGASALGEPVYSFVTEEGVLVFSAVLEEISYADIMEVVDIWVYCVYNGGADGEFTGEGTLELDGYRTALYTGANGRPLRGTFTLSADGKAVRFAGENGENVLFGLDGGNFSVLDGVYGSYELGYRGDAFRLVFDGKGNVAVWNYNLFLGDGIYNVLDAENVEVRVFADLGDGVESFTLALRMDELIVLGESAKGVFVGDDWSVLELDGYEFGFYYAADGSAGEQIRYRVVSEEDGLIVLYGSDTTYLLDREKGSFSRPILFSEDRAYYSEKFSPLIFSEEGNLNCDSDYGYYRLTETGVRLYLEQSGGYRVYDAAADEKSIGVNGTEYFRYTYGTEVVFTGSVRLSYGETDISEDATLTFTPDGSEMFYARGVFTVGENAYSVVVVNRHWAGDRYRGMALYDEIEYSYSDFTEYALKADGTGTFTVIGGRVETTMYDGFEEGPYLTEWYVGFGPVRASETFVSGMVYANGAELTFENAPVEATLWDTADMGYRYMAVFEEDGTQYAVFYYKYSAYGTDADYWLYMIATYSVVETEGYSVGVARYYASNEGFAFPSIVQGDPFGVVLYDENGEVLMGYNAAFNGDGKTAWLIGIGSFDPSVSEGRLGSIYEIVFADGALSSVTVTEYKVRQGIGSNAGGYYFANFFMDGDGSIAGPASLAISTGEGYSYLRFSSVESVGENVWIFHGLDGYDYTMSVGTGADGGFLTDETGEYLQISLTVSARS